MPDADQDRSSAGGIGGSSVLAVHADEVGAHAMSHNALRKPASPSVTDARLDADLLDLLRLGAAQLLYMESVPAYAAIAQTVELAKQRHGLGASKLANAVLRRLDREHTSLSLPVLTEMTGALALAGSHPRWLVARWLERFGADETRRLLDANNREAPLIARPYHVVREQ